MEIEINSPRFGKYDSNSSSNLEDDILQHLNIYILGMLSDGKINAQELKQLRKIATKIQIEKVVKQLDIEEQFYDAIHKGEDELGGHIETHYEKLPKALIILPRPRQKFIEPNIHIIREKHRNTSWSELFYDLIFVIMVNILSTTNCDLYTLGVIFSSIWRIWNETLNYSSRYDMHDFLHKFFYYWEIVCISFMGLNIPDVVKGNHFWFAISFILAHVPLITQYIILLRLSNKFKHIVWLFACILSLSPWITTVILLAFNQEMSHVLTLSIWLGGIFVGETYMFINHFYSEVPVNGVHWVGRLNIFITLVLAQYIATMLRSSNNVVLHNTYNNTYNIFNNTSNKVDNYMNIDLFEYLELILKIMIIFSIKWLYFDVDRIKKHPIRRSAFVRALWSTLHWPLSLCIVFLYTDNLSAILSAILSIITVQSLLSSHKKYKVPKFIRFGIRFPIVVALPILTPFLNLYILSGIIFVLAVFEMIITSNMKICNTSQ